MKLGLNGLMNDDVIYVNLNLYGAVPNLMLNLNRSDS